MRRIIGIVIAAMTFISSGEYAPKRLPSPLNIEGAHNQFRLDFDISAPCPGGTTSAAGRATLCGNNNTVTLSVNGAPAFILQPPGLSGTPGSIGPQGPAGPAGLKGATGPRASPIAAAPIDYALIAKLGPTLPGPQGWQMPSGLTELLGEIVRVQADLTNASQVRVYTQIGDNYGPPDSIVYCQYSLDGGATWAELTDTAVVASTGPQLSLWVPVPRSARRDVLVRAVSEHGIDADVDIEAVHLQVR